MIARLELEAGEYVPATDYIRALRVRQLIKDAWGEMFRSIDALIAPTLPATAAKVGQKQFRWLDGTKESLVDAYVRTSCPASVTGLPAISVPCGFVDGLPVGLQIIGRPFDEALEPFREVSNHDDGLASRLSMRRIIARRTKAAALRR